MSSATLGGLGTSVAGGVNIFGDGSADIILGAPDASVGGQVNSGAVYVDVHGGCSRARQTRRSMSRRWGSPAAQSLIFAGANSGDQAGFSVADAGNVNGVTSGGSNIDDLLIGAPQSSSSAGNAYLSTAARAWPAWPQRPAASRYINLNRVGTTGTTAVPGAVFTGAAGGAGTGFAVSSAGDFNGDGFSDILIGAPDFSGSTTATNQGAAYLFYGAASTSSAFLTGTISLANIPTTMPSVTFTGANAGDLAGSSVSSMGVVNSGQPNEILIGAPGLQFVGRHRVLDPGPNRLERNVLTREPPRRRHSPASSSFSARPTHRRPRPTSSGRPSRAGCRPRPTPPISTTRATSSSVRRAMTSPRTRLASNAGGAQIVEGGLITVPIPTSNLVTVQIGVGTGVRVPSASTPRPPPICRSSSSARRPRRPTSCRSPTSIPRPSRSTASPSPGATLHARPRHRITMAERNSGRHHHDQPSLGAQPAQRRRHDHDHRADARHVAAARLHLDRNRHGHRDRRLGHPGDLGARRRAHRPQPADRTSSRPSAPTSTRRR